MNRIKIMPRTDRPTLNERPIYLTCYLLFLGFAQAILHLYSDYDRIDMPVTKTTIVSSSGKTIHTLVSPSTQMKSKVPVLFTRSVIRAALVALASPPIYLLTVRSFAWSITRSVAKVFWNLPKSGALPLIPPFHWSVLLRTFTSGFLLTMLWEVANALFSSYVAQEPLKNERPITHESKDPNGSLLTGLKGKKLQTRVGFVPINK